MFIKKITSNELGAGLSSRQDFWASDTKMMSTFVHSSAKDQ